MNYRKMLLAAGAVTALTGLAQAQQSVNWIDNHNAGSLDVAFSGNGLFGALGGAFNGPGDSISRCYSIDQFTGGAQSATGIWTNEFFRIFQGHAATTAMNVGLLSIRSSSVDSLAGDACISPFFDTFQPGTATHKQAAVALIGQIPGLQPFGTIYVLTFNWLNPPITAPNLVGTDTGSVFPNTPLIGTLVLEVQGPLNEGPLNTQYYLGSSSERPGTSAAAPGGIANGNAQLASGLFGADPVTTSALSHSRVTALDALGYLTVAPLNLIGLQPGGLEFFGGVAWEQPVMTGIASGNNGSGGADWIVSTSPVDTPDVRVLDTLAGQQGNPADPGNVATLAFNQSWFLWSATPGNGMSQAPTTWCTYAGAPTNGDPLLGPQVVTRHPQAQTIPVCFDPLFVQFLGKSNLSLGKQYTQASSTVAAGGANNNILFQGGFLAITDGTSDITGLGGGPLLSSPDPTLADVTLGIANVGLQLDVAIGFVLTLSEFATGLEVNLQ